MKPLSEKSRPLKFDDFLGQEHIVSSSAPFRKLVEKDLFTSIILWGPPGTGKTTLAHIISNVTKSDFVFLSAVKTGVKEVKEILERNSGAFDFNSSGRKIALFIDEFHRFNKAQQDLLLGPIEKGQIKFIAATTENPSFCINNAILSRSIVFQLKPHSRKDLEEILKKALLKQEESVQKKINQQTLELIASRCSGDARRSLNLLEIFLHRVDGEEGELSEESVEAILGEGALKFDRNQDYRYGMVSALIKSMRASHPDASVYYLARLLECGEDPTYIARRLIIFASEDVGNANPHALNFSTAAAQAVHMLGMPEARIVLSQIVLFLAGSPKSKESYYAIARAKEDVLKWLDLEIPKHLVNAPTSFMKGLGYGKDYKNPHREQEESRKQSYLPPEIKNKRYYKPSQNGYERNIKNYLDENRPYT